MRLLDLKVLPRLGYYREIPPLSSQFDEHKTRSPKTTAKLIISMCIRYQIADCELSLKYSFLRVEHDVYHVCSKAARRNKRCLLLHNAPSQEAFMGTIRYDTIRHDTIRYDTTRHDTTRHDTTRYDTIRYDTIQ